MLKPRHWNEFIDCHNAKVRNPVLPIVEVQTWWNLTLELLEQAHRWWDVTRKWVQNRKYSDYWPHFTTQDEWTMVSTSWKSWGHSDTGPCGCQKGIQLLCITSSLSSMTCSLIWTALCKLQLGRSLKGRKTYTLLWTLCNGSRPNITLKLLQRLVCVSFQHISLILSGSCDQSGSGTWQWIVILRTRLLSLPNTWRCFWSMWRMNTVANNDECRSINPNICLAANPSPLQRLLDLVSGYLIHMICPAMMQNT